MYRMLLAFVMLIVMPFAMAHGANVSSVPNSTVTGHSTIAINTSMVIPNYQNKYVNFLVYPISGNSSYTTLNIINQSSFTIYNMSVELLNNTGFPPFFGQLLIQPTALTPNNRYSIQLRAYGGDPTNYTETVNVSIVNRSLYGAYVNITMIQARIRNGTAGTTAPGTTTAQPTTVYPGSGQSTAATSAYTVNSTTSAATTTAAVSNGSGGSYAAPAIIVMIIILAIAYLVIRNARAGRGAGRSR